MTRRRWIADEVEGHVASLTGANAEHLARVLRARPGQTFDIGTPDGVFLGTITAVEPSRVTFELGEAIAGGSEIPVVHLHLAIFKFDRMEWAIEKAVELGVASIVPFPARRSDAHLVAAASKRVERWRRIAHEAAQQSRRPPCEIQDPIKLPAMLARCSGSRIVLAETVRDAAFIDQIAKSEPPVSLAVGPEGGWTMEELDAFAQAGWRAASLGPTILRAETAAIAAVAVAIAASSK